MGAGTSKQGLSDKQIQKLVKETGFAPSELEFLNRRFRGLCKRGSTLSRADVMDNPHLKANPYVNRLYGVIQKDEFGEVTFETFVHTAAVFRPGKDLNGKLQFIFNLFDYNMDDTLEAHELSDMIKTVRPDIGEEENVRSHLLQRAPLFHTHTCTYRLRANSNRTARNRTTSEHGHADTRTHTLILTYAYIHSPSHINTCTHAPTCTHIHTYTHTHTHTKTHSHTRALRHKLLKNNLIWPTPCRPSSCGRPWRTF
jgi:Ca2+-binding EF-hand superfamily protein